MSLALGKKRPRSDEDAMELKAENDKTVETMLDRLDAIESCSDPSQTASLVTQASSNLLELKSLQRDVLVQLKEASTVLQEKRAELEKQAVVLQSLEYEQAHLQQQMGAQVSTPHLERMCREETQSTDENKDETMNEFLCGSKDTSFEDPANYQTVLTKLHKEINLRGSLERDALQAQKALSEKTNSLKQNQQFLADLPKKLNQMEKASVPLQKFFQQHGGGADSNSSMIGTERTKRLNLARSLPGPLYTLFVQLQSYLDASKEEGFSVQVRTSKPTAASNETEAWFQPDDHVVQLHMTLPGKKSKKVTIEFTYLPKINVVTAQVSGQSQTSALLMNLFPGDEGHMVWSADSVHLKDAASSSMPGRPYHWCNYLAGIHLPAATSANDGTSTLDPVSTKAIVKELERRLDANTTLTNILSALKKKPNPIPTHDSWKDPSDSPSSAACATKLVGWTEEGDKDSVKTFVATLKRKSSKIKATVTVDMSRYPSVPPKWSLTTGGESWGEEHGSTEALESGTNPLYDNVLGQMERVINTQLNGLVNKKDKETYNWILAHQLHRLVRLWDDAAESNGQGQVPTRTIKGKDRVPIES